VATKLAILRPGTDRGEMPEDRNVEMRDACLKEAEAGTRAAATLAAAGDFGRARSMDLLAYETVVQALAYHWVSVGWATFDRRSFRERLYIEEKLLANHPLKQLLIAFFDPVVRAFARDVAEHVKRGEPAGIEPQFAVDEMTAEAAAPPLPFAELNSMKNDGLYPRISDGKITSPTDITPEEYDALHLRVVRRVSVVKALFRSQLRPEVVQQIADRWSAFAREGRSLDKALLFKIRKARERTGKSLADVLTELGADALVFHEDEPTGDLDRTN
jgi:AbiV family abortive infection protein